MWQLVARGNIQQISYIPQTEQHSPFGLMLFHLGNVTIICMYVRVCVCVCVCVCMYAHHKLVYVVVDVIDLCQVVLVLELSNLLLNH